MYIVDSNDKERLSEAKDELDGILNSDEMRGVPVVVVANKQDLPRKFLSFSLSSIQNHTNLIYIGVEFFLSIHLFSHIFLFPYNDMS